MRLLLKLQYPLAIAAMSLALVTTSRGDIVSWNFGTTSGSPSPSSSAITNLAVSDVTQGNNNGTTTLLTTSSVSSGYIGFSASYNAALAARNGVLATGAGGSAYFEFTLTPASGKQVTLNGFSFGARCTSTAPQNYSLRSSLDGFATDIATGSLSVNSQWELKTHTGLSYAVTEATAYRIYGYNGTGSPNANTANWRLDDLSLSVTVTTAAADTTAPVLATTIPADNATGISINPSFSATFSESVMPGSGSFALFKTIGNVSIPISSVSVTAATATFTPSAALESNTDYYVIISPSAVVDLASPSPNPFAGFSSATLWNFKTASSDITPPTIVSVTPANAAVNVAPPTSLSVTFSENVQRPLSAGPMIRVKKASDNTTLATIDASSLGTGVSITGAVATIQIPPTSPLAYGTTYYVEIDPDSFEDTSINSNPFAGISSNSIWTFTTVDAPSLTTTYSQTFSSFTSATLPPGWTTSGAAGYSAIYRDNWGTTSDPLNSGAPLGGFKGNANLFGYHHTSSSGTISTGIPLSQILTLRNTTGGILNDLTIAYKGRTSLPANTRLPAYKVYVNGSTSETLALGYSTSDPDNTQRNVSVSGLAIPIGASFTIVWQSSYPSAGFGAARQIGISEVLVGVGTASYPPSISGPLIPAQNTASTTATVQANVINDGGSSLTGRGFVYSITSSNAAPVIGGSAVFQWSDTILTTGALSTILTGLSPATNYTVRSYATTANGTTYTGGVTFNTLELPPSLTLTPYHELFSSFGPSLVFPLGWTAFSDALPPVQTYSSAWTDTTTNTGGFSGAVTPGVLGYRHTTTTGNLTVSLHLINGTTQPVTSLRVGYQGRVSDTEEGRSPAWAVAVNGLPAPTLAYSTLGNVDTTLTDIISLSPDHSIAPGAEFIITWTSNRGSGNNFAKKIGISNVVVAIPTTPLVANVAANAVTTTTAIFNSSITADGDYPITARGFVYSATAINPNPLIGGTGVTLVVEGGTSVSAFSSAITGLTAATGYSLKSYATNSLGTSYSSLASFRTAGSAGYLTWANANAPGQASDLDHDMDGVTNGVEYFMGATGSSFTANPGLVNGSVTWPKGASYPGVYGSDFFVQTSTNLTSWTSIPSNNPKLHNTSASVSYDLPNTSGPLFIRLSVTP